MNQEKLLPPIIAAAIAGAIGFGAGAILNRPTREKMQAEIHTIREDAGKEIQAVKEDANKRIAIAQKETSDAIRALNEARRNAYADAKLTKKLENLIRLARTANQDFQKQTEKAQEITESKRNEEILRKELEGYLLDIPEVKWCRFVDNSIYVGFDPFPEDGEAIITSTAYHGNQAINFGCHVWAVYADQKNNPPYYGTMKGKWYAEQTCRYGQFD